MPDTPYNKREIDLIIKGVKNHIDDMHKPLDGKLTEILTQTKKTNGRVSSLEKWRSLLIGGWVVVMSVVIPLAVYANTEQYARLEKGIQHHVDSDQANWDYVFDKID